ncbi:MAG: hypothetical protein ACLUI3_10300 [Christensenellales bacterium]
MTQKLNGPVFDQMHRDGLGYVWAISDQASLDEKGVKRGLDMEFVVADTFEELAEKMGLDAATLSETLTNYNAYCDAGTTRSLAALSWRSSTHRIARFA